MILIIAFSAQQQPIAFFAELSNDMVNPSSGQTADPHEHRERLQPVHGNLHSTPARDLPFQCGPILPTKPGRCSLHALLSAPERSENRIPLSGP